MIGKSEWAANNSDWTNNNFPVLVDPAPYDTWSNWEVSSLRELFFLDSNGNYYTQYNIDPIEQVDNIKNTIYDMLQELSLHSHPENIALLNAYPNPFNPIINIAFSMDVGSYPNITIFDLKGTPIEKFPNTYYSPGSYVLQWDASDLASGIYIINFRAGIEIYNNKIVLAK